MNEIPLMIDEESPTTSWSGLRQVTPGEGGVRGPSWLPSALGLRGVLVVLGLIALILFFRKPEALLIPQLIADDAILFRDAWAEGIRSLLQPYAGYTLVAPRLVAWLGVVSVPVASIPSFYAVASLASMLFVCARLMSSRITIPYAWLGALVLPLVPHDGEVYLNLCYIQWSLILPAFALLVVRPAESIGEWTGDVVTLAIAGLSGPFILPAVPFFIVAAVRDRDSRHRLVMAVIATTATIVQLISLFVTGTLAEHAATDSVLRDGLLAIGTKLFAVTFLGRMIPYDIPPTATAILGVAFGVGALVAMAGLARRGHRLLVVALLAAVVFYALSAVVRVKENPLNLIPFEHGDRYFYVPRILLVWTLMLALAGRGRRVAAGLLLLVGLSAATTFRTDRPKHYDWRTWADAIESGETVSVRVSPYDWLVEIPGRTR